MELMFTKKLGINYDNNNMVVKGEQVVLLSLYQVAVHIPQKA